jgi:hypothetical protein
MNAMDVGADALNILIGILSSLVFLLILFGVKPRLRLTWESQVPPARTPGSSSTRECNCAAHYRVAVENLGLGRVVEIEARLWRITRRGEDELPSRKRIVFEPDSLLELPGKWREARRTEHEKEDLKVGDRWYRFRLPCAVSAAALAGADGYFLFQLWSKHGFTNFGRLHRLRIVARHGVLLDDDAFAEPSRSVGFAPVATAIAALGQLGGGPRHRHRFELQPEYVMEESARTVIRMACACGVTDTRSVPGRKDIAQALLEVQESPRSL